MGRKLRNVVNGKFYSEEVIRKELMTLQVQLELEEIGEEEYEMRERDLLERLDALIAPENWEEG